MLNLQSLIDLLTLKSLGFDNIESDRTRHNTYYDLLFSLH